MWDVTQCILQCKPTFLSFDPFFLSLAVTEKKLQKASPVAFIGLFISLFKNVAT